MKSRADAFAALQRGPLDVLVIGGGIVGTGIARDLSLRGLKVALVEQHDLASGTSSRPTRLIHGGLRYLEMFDFALVRTDMREREVLLRLAPHLVRPLPFLMPMYSRSVLYRAKVQAGMQLYDALSFDKSLPTRQWLNRRQVLRAEPGLNPTDLQGAWQFYDGQVSLVERLVIENALDAADQGGLILTYAPAVGFIRDPSGTVTGADHGRAAPRTSTLAASDQRRARGDAFCEPPRPRALRPARRPTVLRHPLAWLLARRDHGYRLQRRPLRGRGNRGRRRVPDRRGAARISGRSL
jgi:glycerol-3-phosphate dehydrogenase